MKIVQSSGITPFGGLNFVLEEFYINNLDKILSESLPDLAPQSKYDWKDILYSFWSIYLCGADCAEDLSGNLKSALSDIPYCNLPSPDRVLNRFKELALPFDVFSVPRGKRLHQFSINRELNVLNIKILKLFNQLNLEQTLDYDNTILYTKKADAKRTYKKELGYCLGVATMGSKIVFIENRNGNSDAKTLQFQTLTRMFELLKDQNIELINFRADGASYQLDVIDLIQKNVQNFYLRANSNQTLATAIDSIKSWKKVRVGNEEAYRGETFYSPFESIAKRTKKEHKVREYRLVVTKTKRKDGQISLFTGEDFNYSAIITNDQLKTEDQIVDFYNQRGASEREFDVLKNDFGWKNLPFSKLEENTVFLIFTAICRNLYGYLIKTFSKKVRGLNESFRIKKFLFRFICIPAKWIRTARQKKLKLYGKINFKT